MNPVICRSYNEFVPPELVPPGCDAVILSPLDVHVYLLEFPSLKQEHIGGAVTYQLRALYPGDPGDTVHDYLFLGGTNSGGIRVLVFAAPRSVYDAYRETGLPLVPGFTLMNKAYEAKKAGRQIAHEDTLAVLLTSKWMEAVFYRNGTPAAYASGSVEGGQSESAVISAVTGGLDCGSAELIFISDSYSIEDIEHICSSEGVEITRRTGFSPGELASDLKASRSGIFQGRKKRGFRFHGAAAAALVVLNICAAALSFHIAEKNAAETLARTRELYEQRRAEHLKAAELKEEIALLTRNSRAEQGPDMPSVYETIGGITSALSGAWVRSLVVRDNAFTLEAEGADSIGVLNALRRSDLFSDITLHQAAPSALWGELFSISGNIRHDSK